MRHKGPPHVTIMAMLRGGAVSSRARMFVVSVTRYLPPSQVAAMRVKASSLKAQQASLEGLQQELEALRRRVDVKREDAQVGR